MEAEMIQADNETFVVYEMDLDFEFDAPWFFDFTRAESPSEVHQAELWFQSVGSHPPSPFAEKLILREVLATVNISSKSKGVHSMTFLDGESDFGSSPVESVMDIDKEGPKNYDGLIKNPKDKAMSVKQRVPRSSTLMNPTKSHLAKKNAPCRSVDSRFQAVLIHGNETCLNNSSIINNHASKRQKLEGGLHRKVPDAKQQTNFIHKEPKKERIGSSLLARPRLTIPREPDLETSQRAQRIKHRTDTKQEQGVSIAGGFKARPLNRKILETPSLPPPKKSNPYLPKFQEFHLKTSERALQHSSAVSSSSLFNNKIDKGWHRNGTNTGTNDDQDTKRPNFVDAPKQEGCESLQRFKACPLNKKIFKSKGELGIFRNNKINKPLATTAARTEKRILHEPPIGLFTRLSLSSTPQLDAGSHLRSTHVPAKVSKENRLNVLQQEHEESKH